MEEVYGAYDNRTNLRHSFPRHIQLQTKNLHFSNQDMNEITMRRSFVYESFTSPRRVAFTTVKEQRRRHTYEKKEKHKQIAVEAVMRN
jgi:hypothetical protein